MGAVCREIWQDGTSLPGGLHLNPSWRFWFQLGNAARPPFPPPHPRLHSNPLSQHLAADSFLTGSASTAGRRSCSGWRSLWLSRCAHPRLGTAARGLLSPGPGVPGVRTREKKKRSAFRNLPGKRPTPKSNSSGSSSGGCGARGPLSSMAHRAGSRRGRLPAVPRLRSKTRARPTSCPAPRPLVPKPCSAACPAGLELEVVGSAARPRPDLLPSAAGERGGGVGTGRRRKRAGGGGGPGPEGRWRPRSAPRGYKVFLSP